MFVFIYIVIVYVLWIFNKLVIVCLLCEIVCELELCLLFVKKNVVSIVENMVILFIIKIDLGF